MEVTWSLLQSGAFMEVTWSLLQSKQLHVVTLAHSLTLLISLDQSTAVIHPRGYVCWTLANLYEEYLQVN